MGRCQPQHFLYLIADEPWLLTELFDFTLRHMQVLIPFRTGIKPYLLTIGLIQLNTHMLNIHITLIASPGRRPGKTGTERIKQQAFTGSPAANDGHHILAEGDGQFPEADFLAIKNRPFNINLTEMRFWRKLCQPLLPYSEAGFRLQ